MARDDNAGLKKDRTQYVKVLECAVKGDYGSEIPGSETDDIPDGRTDLNGAGAYEVEILASDGPANDNAQPEAAAGPKTGHAALLAALQPADENYKTPTFPTIDPKDRKKGKAVLFGVVKELLREGVKVSGQPQYSSSRSPLPDSGLMQERNSLRSRLETAEETIEGLRRDLEKHRQEYALLEQRLDSAGNEKEQYIEELANTRRYLSEAEAQVEKFGRRFDDLTKILELTSPTEPFAVDNALTIVHANELVEKIGILAESSKQSLAQNNAELRRTIAFVEEERNRAMGAQHAAEAAHLEAEQRSAEYLSENRQLLAQLEKLSEMVIALHSQKEDYEKRLAESGDRAAEQARAEVYEARIAEYEAELATQREAAEAACRDADDYRRRLDKANQDQNETNQRAAGLLEQNLRLERERDAADAARDEAIAERNTAYTARDKAIGKLASYIEQQEKIAQMERSALDILREERAADKKKGNGGHEQ